MITIIISPKFRKNDLKNIFSRPEKYGKVIYFLGIKNSRLLFNLYLILTYTLLFIFKGGVNVWVSDIYIYYMNESKYLKINRKKIKYFSMNAEFDILEKGPHEIKKNNYLLFRNEEWSFFDEYSIKFEKKNIKCDKKIYFFGELNLNRLSIKDVELLEYYDAYTKEIEVSNLINEIDERLIFLYKNRKFGDLYYYNQLISLRNAQRYYYLRLIANNFNESYFMGDDLLKYGIPSHPSSYSPNVIYDGIRNSIINLDLGSKSFVENNYPRSLLINKINKESLFQLYQDDFNGNDNLNIFTNKDIMYKLNYKLNKCTEL